MNATSFNAAYAHYAFRLRGAMLWLTVLACRALACVRGYGRTSGQSWRPSRRLMWCGLAGLFLLSGALALWPYMSHGDGLLRDNPRLARIAAADAERYALILSELITKNPQHLLRLTDEDIQLLFGDPDLRRADGPVAVWQYRSEACVLDVYIRDGRRAVDFEVRPRDRAAPDVPATPCLDNLARAGRQLPRGQRLA